MTSKREVAFCDCRYPSHHLILCVEEFHGQKELWVFYRLNHYQKFFKRLKTAIRYLFKKDVDNIDYCEISISNPEELQKIKSLVDEVLNHTSVV